MASNIPERCQPRWGGIGTPQTRSNFARSSSFSTCWKPGSRSGSAPMSPPPWTLFWPRKGADAGAVAPDVAGEQAEVDQRAHVVHRVVVLGDAERPADHGAVGAGVGMGQLADPRRGHAGDGLGALQRPGLDVPAKLLEAAGRVLDEAAILEARREDLPRHRVGQRDVRADMERQVPGPGDRPLGGWASCADPPRRASRRCGSPSARGGRRSDASPGHCSPRGRRDPSPPPRGRRWCRHPFRRPSPDRRRWERVRSGCSCRCCCCPPPSARTSAPDSSSRSWSWSS